MPAMGPQFSSAQDVAGGGARQDDLMGGIAAGAGSAIGSIISTNMATNASKGMAQGQMDFQERMADTYYQRSVADLKAAGLNPMLAYMNGSPGTPTGAMGQAAVPQLGSAVSTAIDAMRAGNDLKTGEGQRTLLGAQALGVAATAARDTAEAKKSGVETGLIEKTANDVASKIANEASQSAFRTQTQVPDKVVEYGSKLFNIGGSAKELFGIGKKLKDGGATDYMDQMIKKNIPGVP